LTRDRQIRFLAKPAMLNSQLQLEKSLQHTQRDKLELLAKPIDTTHASK